MCSALKISKVWEMVFMLKTTYNRKKKLFISDAKITKK